MHKNLRIFNAPNGIEFQSTSLRPSGTNRQVLFHLLLHITLRIITLLLTNYWGKPIRVPEHSKSIEYLHLNIQKGRGAKMHGKHMKTSKYWDSPSCHQCPSQDCMVPSDEDDPQALWLMRYSIYRIPHPKAPVAIHPLPPPNGSRKGGINVDNHNTFWIQFYPTQNPCQMHPTARKHPESHEWWRVL